MRLLRGAQDFQEHGLELLQIDSREPLLMLMRLCHGRHDVDDDAAMGG